jgi:hypothetical protein
MTVRLYLLLAVYCSSVELRAPPVPHANGMFKDVPTLGIHHPATTFYQFA